MSAFFDDETQRALSADLSKDNVKSREGAGGTKLAYLPAYHVIAEANRIFGFGNWSTEIMRLQQIDKTPYEKPGYNGGNPKPMISICYLCHLKLTITNGSNSVSHEDSGFGSGVAGDTANGIGSSIELASKEAVTDALKRCLRHHGDQFGLSLYDKDIELMGSSDIEAATIVNAAQLRELRDLYERRDLSDDWVLEALKAEGYPHDNLEVMRTDWFERAMSLTHACHLAEIEREDYDLDIDKRIALLSESVTIPMLRRLFEEIWTATGKYEDKERQIKVHEIYNELKTKLEAK
ncbi:MAG: hypothetical protein GY774_17945 [Planctomycetes bacterium]|nr:hypothetical protein [Planctomycetota bacterium]